MNSPPYTRHDEVPQLSSRAGKVDAAYYNHVHTALKRIGNQIRLKIPRLKHLDLILQKDAWIIVDTVLNDFPVAAWTRFETEGRDSLHEPIPCEILFFHYAASMILNSTLKTMDTLLVDALNEQVANHSHDVLPFRRD